jgi:hypothetical protein
MMDAEYPYYGTPFRTIVSREYSSFSPFMGKGVQMSSIRFVPTQVHGFFDYLGGIGLISAPFLFRFISVGGVAVILPIVLGIGLIVYSLLTNYELGIPALKFIPMSLHFTFDLVAAAFLAVSPFLIRLLPLCAQRVAPTPGFGPCCYCSRPRFTDTAQGTHSKSGCVNIVGGVRWTPP